MLKSEIASHLFVAFLYFALVSYFRGQFDFSLFWLFSGGFLGTLLLDIDHLLYWFFLQPQEEESGQAKILLKTKNYRGLYLLLQRNHQSHNRLVFHTATFQIVLFLLAFYLLTARASLFGIGMVMAMNLRLLKDEWFDFFRGRKQELADWLFWQVGGVALADYLSLYLLAASFGFLILTILW